MPIFGSENDDASPETNNTTQNKLSEKNTVKTPAPERPVARKVIKKYGNGFTPSIKAAMEGKVDDGQMQAKERAIMYSTHEEEESFTKEQFDEVWDRYLKRLTERPNLRATLSNVPELQDNYKLILKVENTLQEEDIALVKPELVSWLRKELRNSKIELITVVERKETARVIYTDSEKMKALVDKNPAMNLLKQKFNLDFNS